MTSARNFGLTVTGTSSGEELVLCPFHSDSHSSAWFNPKKELFYCAVCGLGLNAVQLAAKLGVEVERDDLLSDRTEPLDYDLVSNDISFDLGEDIHHHVHPYLIERKVCKETAMAYGLRYKTSNPEAIVLPVTNYGGTVKGVVYRYLNPKQVGTRYRKLGFGFPVWPLHRLRGCTEDVPLILTEGPFSAMRLHSFGLQHGFELSTLALLGAKANRGIVNFLARFNCFFLYDADPAGRRACLQMRELLPTAQSWTLSVAPDDMTDEQIETLLTHLAEKRR